MKTTCVTTVAVALLAGGAHAAVMNGSFESGNFDSWVTQDLTSPFFPLSVNSGGTVDTFGWGWTNTPTNGNFDVVTGWDGDGASGGINTIRVAQDVLIDGTTLEFDYRAAWDLTFGATIDRTFSLNIEMSGGGANLQSDLILTAPQNTINFDTGPLSAAVDVSAFLGQTVRISFDWFVPEDNTGPSQATLDFVRLTGVPAPGVLALLGLAGLAGTRRRRQL